MTTRTDLAEQLRDALDITDDAAERLADEYIAQLSGLETIDPDDITDDQRDFIVESARRAAAQDTADDQLLSEISDRADHLEALDAETRRLRDDQHEAIRQAITRGVSVATLVDASHLSRAYVYRIAEH